MSDGNDADSRTSANLTSAGGQSIPQYLQGAFPTTDTSNAASATSASVAADRPARTMAQAFGIPDGTFGGIVSAGEDSSQSSQDDEEQDTSDVPLYIKVKGKGKGRPVMFDRSRSSVAQLHGMFSSSLPEFLPRVMKIRRERRMLTTKSILVVLNRIRGSDERPRPRLHPHFDWCCVSKTHPASEVLVSPPLCRNASRAETLSPFPPSPSFRIRSLADTFFPSP